MAWEIAYLGNDFGLVDKLKDGFKTHFSGDDVRISVISGKTEQEIQEIIIKVISHEPQIVLIDFEVDNQYFLHLARILKRTNSTKRIPQIGIFEILSTETFISECQIAGTTIHHRKGVDSYHILYSCMAILQPDKIFEHGFATAKPNDELYGHNFIKVGRITTEDISVEANTDLTVGQTVNVETHWNKQGIIPSTQFEVTSKLDGGTYYDMKFTYRFKFNFVDAVEKTNETSAQDLGIQEETRNRSIRQVKNIFSTWFKQNFNNSLSKSVKALVMDRGLSVYFNRQRTDRYSFVLRAQPYFQNIKSEIFNLKPNVILFNMDDNPSEVDVSKIAESEDPRYPNSTETLFLLIQTIKTDPNYNPFIIVFNAPNLTDDEVKNVLRYEKLLNYPHEFEPELMEKLVTSFVKKFVPPSENSNEVFYAKKNEPSSTAEILIPIKLASISECDVMFESSRPLDYYTSIKIFLPVPVYITVVPSKKADPAKGLYRALVNGPGDDLLKDLRQYINSVFFRQKDAQKKTERDEFEKRNQKAKEDREKAEAAAAEIASKKKAKEDAKK